MAGFFIVLGDKKDDNGRVIESAMSILDELCTYGYYSTNLHINNGTQIWAKTKVSTFTDYYRMRTGDYIFFIFNRKIYGVGELTNIEHTDDCKFWTYENANIPTTPTVSFPIFDGINPKNRCICFFKPLEYFSYAIDMDEALTAYPNSFKSLRVIQGRSLIKMDDEEAQALYATITKSNRACKGQTIDWNTPTFDNSKQIIAGNNIAKNPNYYSFTIESLLTNYKIRGLDGINEEMAIETAVVERLITGSSVVFDKLTYVSHQVSASPAKPVEYMEWMDVFGYKTTSSLMSKAISISFAIEQYYVIEIKRDPLGLKHKGNKYPQWVKSNKAVANQLMKYVDWTVKNYASGKYPMVKGIIVANGFDDDFIKYCKETCIRNYNSGYRDATPSVWNDIELIKYTFNGQTITFTKVL